MIMKRQTLSSRLNRRIEIVQRCNSKDEFGEAESEFETIKTVYAEIKPVTGKSFFAAQQVNSEITHQVLIRYTSNITPNLSIKFNNRMFEILYVMNYNEANEAILLMCKELVK